MQVRQQEKQRVHCFVDGYNLYYSLFNYANKRDKKYLVWCDLYQLAQQFIDQQTEEITKVYYCSAMYQQQNEQREVQQAFMNHHKEKYKQVFEAVWGQFKPKSQHREVKCPGCHHQFPYNFRTQQEKKTDINIALLILAGAYQKDYDKAILISGDSDFLPVLEHLSRLDDSHTDCKGFTILIPPSDNDSYDGGSLGRFHHYAKQAHIIQEEHLEQAAFTPPAGLPEPTGLSND